MVNELPPQVSAVDADLRTSPIVDDLVVQLFPLRHAPAFAPGLHGASVSGMPPSTQRRRQHAR
jgi:hypothetical protein